MADLASLKISVDSTDVRKADTDLAAMSNTVGRTSSSMDKMIAANNRMSAALQTSNKATIDAVKYLNGLEYELQTVGKSALQLKALEIRMAAARAPTVELQREIRSLGAQLLIAERNADRMAGSPTTGLMGMGNSSKLASHHSLNLFHQLNDVFVSLASGQKPMTVFIQQGSQIGGIMSQAEIGVKGLALAILDMAKAAALAVLTNPLLLALAAAATAAYIAFKSFQSSVEDSGALKEYANSLGLTAKEMKELGPIGITAMDVIKGVWNTISDGLGLESVFSAIGTFFSQLFSGIAETAFELTAGLYGVFVGTYNGIIKVWDMLPAAFGDLVISAVNATIRGLEGMINLAIGAINGLVTQANKVLALLEMPTISLITKVDIPELQNEYAGAANKAGAAFVGEIKNAIGQAKEAMTATGGAFADGVMNVAKDRLAENAMGLKGERTESAAKEAAGKTGKSAGEKFVDEFAKVALNMQAEVNVMFSKSDEQRMTEITEKDKKDLQQIMQEMARESELIAAEQTRILKQNLKTANDGAQMIANVIGGSIGEGIKQLSDVLTKNFPDFMGGIGKAFDGIKNSLNDVLSGFGTSLKEIGAFAGVGGAAAQATGGSALAGSVGGALGGIAGESFKMLGKFGGPLGAIAGGILGGVIGGLLKKTKSASASISMEAGKLDVAGIVGNNAAFKQTANTLAGAVISGINNAANALGAELTGAINLSIGQRKDKFVVDTLGMGRTKGSGTFSFASEAEAVTFAIDKALREGVLGGIRKGTETLLKGFGDLEDRLQKAVDFESVFSALKASADPLSPLLENLDKRFKALIATFGEAGATVEEFASLEKLYQIEREKAIIEGNAKALEAVQSARDLLIEAYDRESQAILTTLERFQSLTADLESFRLSLAEQLMTAEEIYRSAKKSFEEISTLAIEGNEQAIEKLVGVSQKYLDAAQTFLTPEEYNREIQNVMKAVDLAIAQTKSMEQYAQEQLDTLKQSVDGLITLNDTMLSVRQAIDALKEAQSKVQIAPVITLVFSAPATPEWEYTPAPDLFADGGMFGGGLRIVGEEGPELEATGASRIYNASQTADMLSGGSNVANQIAGMREEMKASLYAVAKNTAQTANRLNRWDGDGLPDTRNYAI